MRATVRDLIIAEAQITALLPADRWFQAGAVLDIPVFPFAILRWLSPVRSDSGRDMKQLQVAVYDRRGSYETIDQILGDPDRVGPTVYTILAGSAGVSGSDGYIAQADYLGNSGDQEDTDYKANMMFSSWQIAGRNL